LLEGKVAMDAVMWDAPSAPVPLAANETPQGLSLGMTEAELNSEQNLVAACDRCNLGLGDEPLPVRSMVAIIWARLGRADLNRRHEDSG
jgi:hypothetical protein